MKRSIKLTFDFADEAEAEPAPELATGQGIAYELSRWIEEDSPWHTAQFDNFDWAIGHFNVMNIEGDTPDELHVTIEFIGTRR